MCDRPKPVPLQADRLRLFDHRIPLKRVATLLPGSDPGYSRSLPEVGVDIPGPNFLQLSGLLGRVPQDILLVHRGHHPVRHADDGEIEPALDVAEVAFLELQIWHEVHEIGLDLSKILVA